MGGPNAGGAQELDRRPCEGRGLPRLQRDPGRGPCLRRGDTSIPRVQTPSSNPSFLIFSCHTNGARWCTLCPSESTATVTGISCTSNS